MSYDFNEMYSYPGYPAWVPSTSLMTIPMGGLGAAGGGDLGAARLMGPTELLQVGKLYTYRTFSLVPLQENASWRTGWSDLVGRTSWENHSRGSNILRPPGTVRSLYQAATPETYSGPVSRYRGQRVYNTSLTFAPTRAGVTVAQAKDAAINILNAMRSNFRDDEGMKIFEGNLYERGVGDATPPARSVTDWIRETVTGQDPAEAARQRQQEAAASDQRMLYARIGAGLAVLLGLFLATRKGSAKVERQLQLGSRAEGAIGGAGRAAGAAVRGAGSLAAGAVTGGASRLFSSSSRAANPGGGGLARIRVVSGNRAMGMRIRDTYKVESVTPWEHGAKLILIRSWPASSQSRQRVVGYVRWAKHLDEPQFVVASGNGIDKVTVEVTKRTPYWTEADLPLPDFTKNRRRYRRNSGGGVKVGDQIVVVRLPVTGDGVANAQYRESVKMVGKVSPGGLIQFVGSRSWYRVDGHELRSVRSSRPTRYEVVRKKP